MSQLRVTSISPSGVAMLEDGREMQLVMASGGSLGLRPLEREDHFASLDQARMPVIDQSPQASKRHFDVSGLDQT